MENLSKRFGATIALDNVSLSLNPGQILALVGENGAGKSTLMKILSGAYPPTPAKSFSTASPTLRATPSKAAAPASP